MIRQLLAIALVVALVIPAFAAENLKGFDQEEGIVWVKSGEGFGFLPKYLMVGDTTTDAAAFLAFNDHDNATTVTLTSLPVGAFVVATQTCNGTVGHKLCLPTGMTFNGTSVNATFNAENETLIFIGVSSDRAAIIENIGSVGFQ
jgi:hypothetical protein